MKQQLAKTLLAQKPIMRGEWQSEAVKHRTHELSNVIITAAIPPLLPYTVEMCDPDLPWAEQHFAERVSGKPLNPPPSYSEWPWHSAKEANRYFTSSARFDHTYPERFWPKFAPYHPAVLSDRQPIRGIYWEYGDLADVVNQLRRNIWTRQAYLPVFFPEDTGANHGQRVPCTLGYHFIRNGAQLDINYFLRSCDLTRHFHNDIYFAMRLLQWVKLQLPANEFNIPHTGQLTMFISNLHLFSNDEWRYER